MDKLKPLITHKFWILFGLVLLVPLVAWWLTSGSLQAETTAKEAEIKTAEGQVPPIDSPNEQHVAGAKEIVDAKEQAVVEQIKRLWDRQQALMTWPRGMQKEMEKYGYRDEINSDYRLRYRVQYEGERQRVESIVKPFKVNPLTFAEEGLVQLDQMPFVDSRLLWASRPPTSEAMWDAQEDIWLTEAVLKAIAEVNMRNETGKKPLIISESPIPLVKILMFKGGRRLEPGAVVDPNASSGDDTDTGSSGTGLTLFGNTSGGGGESDGGSSGVATSASFDPEKVFGPAALEATAEGEDTGSETPSFGMLGGRTAEKLERRYIDDDEALPYRTRGFYLHVTMRNEFVPDLMLALSNMDWPTSIAHVHMVELYPDEVEIVDDGTGARRSSSGEDGGYQPRSIGVNRPRIPPRSLARPVLGRQTGGYGTDGGVGGNNLLTAAIANRAMADVVIAGVITIYKPPTLAVPVDSPGESTPGVTGEPDPVDPAVTDPTIADPTMTDPATTTDPAGTDPIGDPAVDVSPPADAGANSLPSDESAGTPPEPDSSNPGDPGENDSPESPSTP